MSKRTTGRMSVSQSPIEVRDHVDDICFAYQQAVLACTSFDDILGVIYMELGHQGHRQHLGQFFTPPNIAKLNASMLIGNQFEPRSDGQLHTVIDPAAGSGVMLLAAADYIVEQAGAQKLKEWSFTFVDLDLTCSLISAT